VASAADRARTALTIALRESLPPGVVAQFVGGSHARRFADNLLPGLSQAQITALRQQILAGAGGELRPSKSGRVPAHAPYSSAALAANAFGRWLGSEEKLRIAELAGFSPPLEIESRQKISHGGGIANFDCLLHNDDIVVGVESKLTETLVPHKPVVWKDAYYRAEIEALLDDGWRGAFVASRDGEWHPEHLGLEQLIKHALALASRFADRELHLVYVWWEPTNADEIEEVHAHRAEVNELSRRLDESVPRLHALTYAELFAQWHDAPSPAWVSEHLTQLHSRYMLAV
jgi:hypothetical protein